MNITYDYPLCASVSLITFTAGVISGSVQCATLTDVLSLSV